MSFNDKYKFSDDEEIDESPLYGQPYGDLPALVSEYNSEELFFMKMAAFTGSPETFESILYILNDASLGLNAKIIRRAAQDPRKAYDRALEFTKMDLSERMRQLNLADQIVHRNKLAAARKVVFDECRPPLSLGCDVHTRKTLDEPSELLEEAIRDRSNLVVDAESEKRVVQVNAVNSVMEAVPIKIKSNLQTTTSKRRHVEKLVDDFTNGTLPHAMNPEVYRRPKEPGVMLPHTMNSQDWVATNVSKIVNDQFGGAVIPCFMSKSVMDLSPYSGSPTDYVLFNREDDSPMHLQRNPSLHCQAENPKEWEWRRLQPQLTAEVDLDYKKIGSNSVDQMERASRMREKQCALADSYVKCKLTQRNLGSPEVRIPELLATRFNAQALLLFAKRGFSTRQEMIDNPGLIHLLSLNNASDVTDVNFIKIMLSDYNSVILFPIFIWEKGRFFQKRGRVKYRSAWGMELAVDHSKFSLYFALVQLSYTRAMFKAWNAGLSFDWEEHRTKIYTNLRSKNSNYLSLFGSYASRSATDKQKAFERMLILLPGPIIGM